MLGILAFIFLGVPIGIILWLFVIAIFNIKKNLRG